MSYTLKCAICRTPYFVWYYTAKNTETDDVCEILLCEPCYDKTSNWHQFWILKGVKRYT